MRPYNFTAKQRPLLPNLQNRKIKNHKTASAISNQRFSGSLLVSAKLPKSFLSESPCVTASTR